MDYSYLDQDFLASVFLWWFDLAFIFAILHIAWLVFEWFLDLIPRR